MHAVKPVRLVSDKAKEMMVAHLMKLPVNDRYLRFCFAVSDESITQYVDQLELVKKDVVFGVFDDHDPTLLVGMLHVAPTTWDSAEFAISVDGELRQRGIGDALFERGLLHCESVGIKRIYMNCLSSNTAIKKMAVKRGMTVTTEYSESMASLDLKDKNSIIAWLKTVQSDQIGVYDLSCKYARRQWEDYIEQVQSTLCNK